MSEEKGRELRTTKDDVESGQVEATKGEPNLDSGYAWIILLVMFLLSSTTNGTSRVYGLVYARQIQIGYYDHEEASWPIATASTVENLAGVLTPALAQVLSWRQIQLLSTSLFIASNLGAYFSDSLALDILCLGVVQGLALSTGTVLTLAINNDYFDKYRTTAYGIAMSGATCGVFFLCPMVNLILDADPQTFRPVYLTIAAVLVLNLILSLFIIPRSQTRAALEAANSNLNLKDKTSVKINRKHYSRFERTNSVASVSIAERTRRNSYYAQRSRSERKPRRESPDKEPIVVSPSRNNSTVESKTNPLSAALDKLAEEESAIRSREGPKVGAEEELGLWESLKLLSCPYLHCVWIMLTLYYLVSRIFIIILADFGEDHGLSSGESYQLLNFWSLGELLGRVVLASLIDLRLISVKSCIALTCGLLALSISCMVVVENFYVYASCSTLTASLISLEYMLINALMVEYLGKNKAIGCYSVAALISSLLLFGRPSLIGLFRDKLGSYDGLLLLLAGACFTFAALFALLEPLLVRRWPKAASNQLKQ